MYYRILLWPHLSHYLWHLLKLIQYICEWACLDDCCCGTACIVVPNILPVSGSGLCWSAQMLPWVDQMIFMTRIGSDQPAPHQVIPRLIDRMYWRRGLMRPVLIALLPSWVPEKAGDPQWFLNAIHYVIKRVWMALFLLRAMELFAEHLGLQTRWFLHVLCFSGIHYCWIDPLVWRDGCVPLQTACPSSTL